jgi:hypothetical protein
MSSRTLSDGIVLVLRELIFDPFAALLVPVEIGSLVDTAGGAA